MKFPASGFTLVELLVVISIISIIGIFTISNYSSFGEDKNLKNAVLDTISLLRQAQTNAMANVKCNTKYNAVWQVQAVNNKTIAMSCLEGTAFEKKRISLDEKDSNIEIKAGTSCPSSFTFTVNFAPGGTISFEGYPNCSSLTIPLKNSKSSKSLIIEKGGRIYEE